MKNYPTSEKENFNMVSLKLASPERIREWSSGEVTKPETINYRTQKSERGGLFDEKIFGPDKDYECYCGKYRGIRYKGIICEKCSVELTRSIVRRERMGHIELSVPVAHIWFLKGIPSRISTFLGLNSQVLEKVIYFASYIVTSVNEEEKVKILHEVDSEYKTKIKNLQDEKSKDKLKELYLNAKKEIDSLRPLLILDEATYARFSMKYGSVFEAGIGAEAVSNILKSVNMDKLSGELEKALESAGAAEREKLNKRLSLVRSMIKSGVRPEWMFVTVLPIIPPALRPIVSLEGGRHATSDVNDLYRRVINRNNRLKKLQDIKAPDVILRNEKRILQEAVDALIDNSIRHSSGLYSAMSQSQRRPLKSLSDTLKGKQGIFRQNLLGKRVDYSGRSVIVVGPELNLNQCGLPKHMALELFKPFVISKLLENELAHNIRGAGRLIDEQVPEVWAMLEEVIEGKYVLLNRAPTLHRLGIQAFMPLLIEGNAIQIHPLVCSAFNADFDGDQMAVHVPLSEEAQFEAREIMASDKNLLKPGDGKPVISSKMLDIVLGTYWMTVILDGEKGEGHIFPSPNNAITVSDFDEVSYRAKIKVLGTKSPKYSEFNGEPFETSIGRLLFNSVLPSDYPFINKVVDIKIISSLVDDLIEKYGFDRSAQIVDKIKNFGFKYATHSGVTWGLDDIKVPDEKYTLTDEAREQVDKIEGQYNEGLLSKEERYRKSIEIWHNLRSKVEKVISETLDKTGSVYYMWQSGARGSLGSITNMAGIKGLIASTSGEAREQPILTSGKEGLSPLEYFTSTHGSRKGLADTALNTAKAGYLTRRLFDVAQDMVITEKNCSTREGFNIVTEEGATFGKLAKDIVGRYLMVDVLDDSQKVLFKKGHLLSIKDAEEIEEAGVKLVSVRSPLACKTAYGICQTCYGIDPSRNKLVELGTAVGTVAAQAIGEPATQLTMRTFHAGGTASVGGDITAGLPRVEEIFERRIPKNQIVISKTDGKVIEIIDNGDERKIIVLPEIPLKSKTKKAEIEYPVHFRRSTLVKEGDSIKKGDFLTDGSADLQSLLKYAGKEKTQNYIIHEVLKIYELQAASISRKHIETIVRQMFSRRKIKDVGETKLVMGEVVSITELNEANDEAKEAKLTEAKGEELVVGITEVSLSRKSFLSAASFQYTTRVLINAALRGREDTLRGLKENVILGRLIPAGTGFPGSEKAKQIEELQRERDNRFTEE